MAAGMGSVVLSRYDGTKKWHCGEQEGAVLVGQTPDVFVCMHPVKIGFMHFVIVPKGRAKDAVLTAGDAGLVRTLQRAALDVIAKYKAPAACRKFLFKQKGKFQADPRVSTSRRWAGPAEIEAYAALYGATDTPFALGFEAYTPVIGDLHLHVISKDFAYIDDEDDWNMYTQDWGLMPPASLLEVLEGGAALDFPTSKDMNDLCEGHALTCFHTGKTFEAVDDVRRHSIAALLGKGASSKAAPAHAAAGAAAAPPARKSSAQEQEREAPKTDDGHVLVTSVELAQAQDAQALGTAKVVKQFEARKLKPPVKPSKKYKPVKASLLSCFGKWCEYYYHLKYIGEEEGQEEAAAMMRELANHTTAAQLDMVQFNEMQMKCRDMFYGAQADAKRKRAEWDGDKVALAGGEVKKPKYDAERCPF
eukprot:TRINITY_DN5968_c0_g1_i1.p1 TRINITY_DN5968_c0_g1~~TRINITY_DN5968_c0_g1_i1.p1  ORF type:complete len:419 (+),score=183.65 TRINITY_DN5968_c0_g1_i1:132-1388(+)